jgi:hypothetical protein
MLFIARTSLTHYCQDMRDRCKAGIVVAGAWPAFPPLSVRLPSPSKQRWNWCPGSGAVRAHTGGGSSPGSDPQNAVDGPACCGAPRTRTSAARHSPGSLAYSGAPPLSRKDTPKAAVVRGRGAKGRRLHAQHGMRPLLIVLLAELFQQRRPGRKLERPAAMPHAVIQRTMKAFDFAACLRVIRQIDALLDQAHERTARGAHLQGSSVGKYAKYQI